VEPLCEGHPWSKAVVASTEWRCTFGKKGGDHVMQTYSTGLYRGWGVTSLEAGICTAVRFHCIHLLKYYHIIFMHVWHIVDLIINQFISTQKRTTEAQQHPIYNWKWLKITALHAYVVRISLCRRQREIMPFGLGSIRQVASEIRMSKWK